MTFLCFKAELCFFDKGAVGVPAQPIEKNIPKTIHQMVLSHLS